MVPSKSRKSGKFHGKDCKSTKKCSDEGECRNPDCLECGIYRQRIPPKKKEPTTVRIMERIKRFREGFAGFMIFPVCIINSFVVMRNSDLVPMDQMCLECIFRGLFDYMDDMSLVSSAATMFGGCGIWYFNAIYRDKFMTFVFLCSLQLFDAGMRTLVGCLMVYQVAVGSVLESAPVKPTLGIAIFLFLLEYFTSSTIKRGLEDPILLLLPFAKALSYIMYDDKSCRILESLGLALVWMLLKKHRSRVAGTNT